LTPEWIIGAEFTVDHIIPEFLGGKTVVENLCLACLSCNLIKGTQATAIDPQTGQIVPLFNPQEQTWPEQFHWQMNDLQIIGSTSIGRGTINTLRLNRPMLVEARRWWLEAGWQPMFKTTS
jgi:hypothetical protein